MMLLGGASRCFRCFSRNFTASEVSFAAEILDFGAIAGRNNSKPPAVFRCFSLFSLEGNS
jgi:hypothetical protein